MTAPQKSRCEVFAWIGQTFASCDNCGKPYWEHPYEYVLGIGNPFTDDGTRQPITAERAAVVKAKWAGAAG